MLKNQFPNDFQVKRESNNTHISLGKIGENVAATYLTGKGYEIRDRNWRLGHLELDIVCEKSGLIIFVEVKTRRCTRHGGPVGAITPDKKLHIAMVAEAWLMAHEAWQRQCRFDIICIVGNGTSFSVEHYKNAFELPETLDCCYSDRQPW